MYRRVLLQIVASIGSAVKVDAVTTSGTRARYARVCIMLDFSHSLPRGIWVRIGDSHFFQSVTYESLSNCCFTCRLVGHKIDQCNQSKAAEQTAAPGENAAGGHWLCYRDWHERRTWATVRALIQSPTRILFHSRFGATSVHSSPSPPPTDPAPATSQPGESGTKRAFAFSKAAPAPSKTSPVSRHPLPSSRHPFKPALNPVGASPDCISSFPPFQYCVIGDAPLNPDMPPVLTS